METENELQDGQQTLEDASQEGSQYQPVEEFQIPDGAPEFDGNGRRIYYDAESPEGYVNMDEEPERPPVVVNRQAPAPTPQYQAPRPQVQQVQQAQAPVQPVAPSVMAPAPAYWDASTYMSNNKDRLNELSLVDPVAYSTEVQNAYKQQERSERAIKAHQMAAVRQQVPELYDRHSDAISDSLDMLDPAGRRDPSAVLYAVKRAEGLEIQRLMGTGMSFRDATIQVSEQTLNALRPTKQTTTPKAQTVQTTVNPNAPKGSPSGSGAGSGGVATGTRTTTPKNPGLPGFPMTSEEARKIKAAFGRK